MTIRKLTKLTKDGAFVTLNSWSITRYIIFILVETKVTKKDLFSILSKDLSQTLCNHE